MVTQDRVPTSFIASYLEQWVSATGLVQKQQPEGLGTAQFEWQAPAVSHVAIPFPTSSGVL